jgi:hypothetical protein
MFRVARFYNPMLKFYGFKLLGPSIKLIYIKVFPMVALKWPLHTYVLMFIRLFLMLDKGPNGTHVSGDWRPLLVNCLLSLSLGTCW